MNVLRRSEGSCCDGGTARGFDAAVWPARLTGAPHAATNSRQRLCCPPRADVPTQLVLKIHSRCNLACDYCYMYTGKDQSWAARPRVMSGAVVEASVERIADHARRHGLATMTVILHGGEPLLVGRTRLAGLLDRLGRAFADLQTGLDVVIQTNGVLLDEAFLAVLDRYEVSVGVSLDGDAVAHDRHRRDHRNRGSHSAVTGALTLLQQPRYCHLYGGLLCTVDLANDPVETYEALLSHEPPMVDFLLPHGTWDTPPAGLPSDTTPYGDWLVAAFDHWRHSGGRRTRVRLFESIVDICLGGWSTTESIGWGPPSCLIVETDGAIEMHDTLKTVGTGAGATGLSILWTDLDQVAEEPEPLGAECLDCPVVDVCGGGLRTHRYRSGSGFANPSVYCHDLAKLIGHVDGCLTSDPSDLPHNL